MTLEQFLEKLVGQLPPKLKEAIIEFWNERVPQWIKDPQQLRQLGHQAAEFSRGTATGGVLSLLFK